MDGVVETWLPSSTVATSALQRGEEAVNYVVRVTPTLLIEEWFAGGAGRIMTLCGPPGRGKSTLLRHVVGRGAGGNAGQYLGVDGRGLGVEAVLRRARAALAAPADGNADARTTLAIDNLETGSRREVANLIGGLRDLGTRALIAVDIAAQALDGIPTDRVDLTDPRHQLEYDQQLVEYVGRRAESSPAGPSPAMRSKIAKVLGRCCHGDFLVARLACDRLRRWDEAELEDLVRLLAPSTVDDPTSKLVAAQLQDLDLDRRIALRCLAKAAGYPVDLRTWQHLASAWAGSDQAPVEVDCLVPQWLTNRRGDGEVSYALFHPELDRCLN